MSNNLKKYSFIELLEQGKIRIPKIQRDYAQGRNTKHVKEIRKVFIHKLLLVIKGKLPSIELDFVYGSNCNNAFEPLDGQQRLTTLFLLHWMMGVDLSVQRNKKLSLFTYETRKTTSDFCDELVQHKAQMFVEEAQQKGFAPSFVIKGRDWFKWEWKFDPSILSMLVMIDAIYDEMGKDWHTDLSYCRENLNNITFHLLNLGEFGLSNELFIKMNARGKQLSDFDKLKSTIEEELQIQQHETDAEGVVLASPQDEEDWRTLIDGAWIDLFWHKYAFQRITEAQNGHIENAKQQCLEVAKLCECQFKKLLLRLIALQLFESDQITSELADAAYKLDDDKIDNLLFAYNDSLIELRSNETYKVDKSIYKTIDFRRLIDDVNSLIYKDNNIYYETSSLLSNISHIEKDERSLFESFLEPSLPNDVTLIFYAMLLYLRAFPLKKHKRSDEEPFPWYINRDSCTVWCKNLEIWVKSVRNILLNINNNQRIDKIQYAREATRSLKQLVGDLVAFVGYKQLNIEEEPDVVRLFLQSIEKTYTRIDNQSLQEEKLKASLILENKNWEKLLEESEKHEYLWGQIRCLLNWSGNQLEEYKVYSSKLLELLECIKNNHLTYYAAMLAFDSACWKDNNRLFLYNRDRDNSFKRYLRDRNNSDERFGSKIKDLIDVWKEKYNEKTASEFLKIIIEKKSKDCEVWVQCILKDPTILNESWNKRLFEHRGHVILAQRITVNGHCFDPIFLYFRNLCINKEIDAGNYKLYDSKGEYEHAFQLVKNGNTYLVEWKGLDGIYAVKENNSVEGVEYTPDKLVPYMEGIIG